ncbi:MAG: hypothetical protein ACOY3O_11765 [Thermodesulfobacteriota bacterium]
MEKGLAACLIFACLAFFLTALTQPSFGATCPSSLQYAQITYNHQLLNQYVTTGTFSQASGVTGSVGIKITPAGIANAGSNYLQRTIDLVYTTSDCDCLSETAYFQVTVTVTGACVNGVLDMQISEVYPDSSALVTCTGGDSCPSYTQLFPGSTTNFTLKMTYAEGTNVTQPYQCPSCSGIYSWTLHFQSGPPEDDIPLAPIVPLLNLLLHEANR